MRCTPYESMGETPMLQSRAGTHDLRGDNPQSEIGNPQFLNYSHSMVAGGLLEMS